jgi:hypothetical protein
MGALGLVLITVAAVAMLDRVAVVVALEELVGAIVVSQVVYIAKVIPVYTEVAAHKKAAARERTVQVVLSVSCGPAIRVHSPQLVQEVHK